jgi:hypothetical protein
MRIFNWLFGRGRNVIAETAHVFRENTEAAAIRRADFDQASLAQFTAEFQHARKGLFDRFVDGLNRLPRPMIVFSLFWLFSQVVTDPVYFAEIMVALELVPTPLWAGTGTILTFYFGGRMQAKMLEARKDIATVAQRLPQTLESIEAVRAFRSDSPGVADTGTDARLSLKTEEPSKNAAVAAWRETTS